MVSFRVGFSVLVLLTAVGCATEKVAAPVTEEVQAPAPLPKSEGGAADGTNIDYRGLQDSLGLSRAPIDLGYAEKPFNTCEVGFGYSSSHQCRRAYFSVVNLRLQCRDSEGSVGVVSSEQISPVGGAAVKWTLGKQQGQVETDGEGYAQIRAVSAASARQARLR